MHFLRPCGVVGVGVDVDVVVLVLVTVYLSLLNLKKSIHGS